MGNGRICRIPSRTFAVLALLGAAAIAGGAPASAADWAHFLGPNYDGRSVDGKLTADGVEQVWAKVVHPGCSSVAVVAGKLFTMGNEDGTEHVYCLDASTGEELWRFSYQCELLPKLYPGGPNATPTVEAGKVYTISRMGHIFCLDAADGGKIWEASAEHGVPRGGWWGFSSAPTIVDNLVIYNVGDTGLALDKATGKVAWSSAEPAKAYATVVSLEKEVMGRPAVVVQTTENVHVLDPTTGNPLLTSSDDWRARASNCNGVSPVLYNGCLYLIQGKQGLSKLSVDDGVWKENWLSTSAAYSNDWFAFNRNVFHDGFVFAIVGEARRTCRLVCVDAASGELAWEKPAEFANLLLVGDSMLTLTQTGELAWGSLDGSRYTEQHRSKPLEGGAGRSDNGVFWPYPVLVDGYLYARTTKGHLTCLKFN